MAIDFGKIVPKVGRHTSALYKNENGDEVDVSVEDLAIHFRNQCMNVVRLVTFSENVIGHVDLFLDLESAAKEVFELAISHVRGLEKNTYALMFLIQPLDYEGKVIEGTEVIFRANSPAKRFAARY